MLYFFERDIQRTIIETRQHDERFEIVRRNPDGTQTIHTAETPQHFLTQLEDLAAALGEEQWRHRPANALFTR